MIRKLWKPFVIFFFLSFLIINWSDVSWIFNYRAVSRYASDVFQKKEIEKFEYSDKSNVLEIPKLEILVPIVFGTTTNNYEVYKELDGGVVFYPTSVLPGNNGQTIILGHSAPENWPKIKYDWVFSHISDLVPGDEITIHYNNKKFTYSVGRTIFLERGGVIPENDLTNSINVLVLISCWPPGKDIQRIAVESTLKQ